MFHRYSKGIEGWIPADIRNAPNKSAKERLQERLNKLERQLLEPDYKVSSKEKAKIRAKIKGIIKALQATVPAPAPAPAPKTAIITDRQTFQSQWREAQKGKLTDEQIDAQLEIVDAFMNTFAKEMDMTVDEAYAIVEQIGTEELKDALNQVDAYHGSGAFFDCFDVKFIGTGEGNQAFGWGIYVSERKGVAKSYADGVGKDTAILKRNGVQSKPEEIAMEIVNQTIPDNAISDKSRQYVLDVITEILSETNKARVKALTETQLILVSQRIKEWENWQDLYRVIS